MTLFILSFGDPVVLITLCLLTRMIDAALRIFGGRDTDPQEYPYVVKIEAKVAIEENAYFKWFAHLCTGSVLTPVWTLSSGHCIRLEEFTTTLQSQVPDANIKYVIRYGATTARGAAMGNLSCIVGSVVHPSFKVLKTPTGDAVTSDVGLLKTTPIRLNQYAKLSAVEYAALEGHAAAAVGYGLAHNAKQDSIKLSKTLQVLDVVIKRCNKHLIKGSHTPIVCLVRKCGQPLGSLCAGDSGGPLIHRSGVVGLNQMGEPDDCTLRNARAGIKSNLVGVITPISPFVEWISDQIINEV